jgi:ankyrin repeat protein
MRKIAFILLTFTSFAVYGQKNTLLESTFWQTKPDVNAVKAEIEKGANPSQLNSNSFDPVVMAINAGAPDETVKYLLIQPGNAITKKTHDGRIYIHWAANRGNIALVEYLIKKGSPVSILDSHGATPVTFAAAAGQLDTKLYDIFAANGVNLKTDVNSSGANALLLAIAADKDLKLTDYFIAKGISLDSKDAQGNNAFAYAARGGNVEVLKALVKKGVTIDPNAMLMAAEGSRRGSSPIEVFKYLETLNLKPTVISKEGKNALHLIVRKAGQQEIINYFLAAGVDVNQADNDGNTVFMNATAANRDTVILATLLAKTKNINQVNKKGLSALTMALNSNSAAVVNYLLAKGADLNVIDVNGNKLNYYLLQSFNGNNTAGLTDFDEKVKVLQTKGVDLAAAQKDGSTLYHLAVVKGDMNLFKRLEKLGIDVNAKNAEGLSALHRAAMVAKDDVLMKYLIAAGAKKELKTNFDETAFDLASENESLKGKVAIDFLK